MPLVLMALACGWWPLILFKNVVGQHGQKIDPDREPVLQIGTCDKGAKTSLQLVGFFRGPSSNRQFIALTGADGTFVSATQHLLSAA